MSATAADISATPHIGFFERWLTVWVFLCIVLGIALGQLLPAVFHALGALEVAKVNIPVGLLGIEWVISGRRAG
jgi:ACR3 family arsenite transporter